MVGAGLAGLTAATVLASHDIEVVVVEARHRVGGRTHGIEVAPGSWVDAGGAYLGGRHTELRRLIAELGLSTVPTTMTGDSRFALTEGYRTTSGRFPPLDAVALGGMFELLEELTSSVRVDAPWLTPDAERLDSMTAAEWLDQHLPHPDVRLFFPLFLGEMMAADPAGVSVLHMAFYLRSGGGVRYLNAFSGGAQEARVAGGAHQLCELLAARLGDRVRLGAPVHAVGQDRDIVTAHTTQGDVRGTHAVIALPPRLADTIDYRPGLPTPRSGQRTAPGCAVKVHVVYPAPLWRESNYSGWSMSAQGPLLSTVDDSAPDGGVGVLTGFVTGREAHRFIALPPMQRRAAVLAQVRRLFPRLPAPIGYHVTDWLGDEYSNGCYAALFGPGDWVRQGPHLTRPHHRVHWAGTETSVDYFGLMEGAIRSGRRAAAKVLGG